MLSRFSHGEKCNKSIEYIGWLSMVCRRRRETRETLLSLDKRIAPKLIRDGLWLRALL